ncbi:MAG: NERD domain-containing protein [Granulosicoccus sp.]
MIVKERDATLATIKKLEVRAVQASDNVKRSACTGAAMRLRADPTSEKATELIDKQFADSEEWAVVHDLRLRVKGHALQINHMLVSSALCFVFVDTRFLSYGLKMGEAGQFHVFNKSESRRVASPINKMAKDLRIFRDHIQKLGVLPSRLGIVKRALHKGYILTDPSLRIDLLNASPEHGDIGVYPSDALFPMLWKKNLGASRILSRNLSADDLYELAAQIADLHTPAYSPSLLESDSLATDTTRSLLSAYG